MTGFLGHLRVAPLREKSEVPKEPCCLLASAVSGGRQCAVTRSHFSVLQGGSCSPRGPQAPGQAKQPEPGSELRTLGSLDPGLFSLTLRSLYFLTVPLTGHYHPTVFVLVCGYLANDLWSLSPLGVDPGKAFLLQRRGTGDIYNLLFDCR